MAMEFLVFQLQAPLASWGEPAVGEFRGSASHASHSAVVGLLGAALGLSRDAEAAHAALRDGYGLAIGLLASGTLLRDFHTAQVPPRSALKNRPHFTRRQELAVGKLGTILSSREYRQNAACLVALQLRVPSAPAPSLAQLAGALRKPKFALYLGRKTCVPSAPLWPQLIEAASAHAAFERYAGMFESARQAAPTDARGRVPLEPMPPLIRIAFDDHVHAGVTPDLSTRRKDRLIRREGWQFGDRNEHIAIISPEE